MMDRQIKENIESISSEVLNGENYHRNDFARKIMNYPAMMVPSVQEPIIKILSIALNNDVSLIDPFMGAANTLVTGMKYGANVFGQDINPLSILLSQVKTNIYSQKETVDAIERIKARVESDSSIKKEVSFANIDKWFTKNIQIELSRIYRAIKLEESVVIRKFFWVVMAETIRLTSNDRTSTFKMHMRPVEEIRYRNISATKTFLNISKKNIQDIIAYNKNLENSGQTTNRSYKKEVEVVWGNTNKEVRTNKTFNLLVTSPPYGDNQTTVTYGQFSYLMLHWIPLEDIDNSIELDYLKTTQEIDNHSLGGKRKIKIEELEENIFPKSKTLSKFINQFNDEDKKKAEKVTRFINDLDNSIDIILPKMRKNSYLVWTIGNRNVNRKVVRNDLILTELFRDKGIELFTDLERDILNKRMPGRNNFSNTMNKEKILIFRKSN